MRKIKLLSVVVLSIISAFCFTLLFCGCDCSGSKEEYEHNEESIVKLSVTAKTLFQDETFVIKLLKDGVSVQTAWAIDDSYVATVATDGTVVGKNVGKTKIRCVYEETEYICDLTVELPSIIPAISFINGDASIKTGETRTLEIKSDFEIPSDVVYYATDDTIVSVSKTAENRCEITGLKIGETEVIVSYLWKGLTIFDSIEIIVKSDVEIVLSATSVNINATLPMDSFNTANTAELSAEVYRSGSKISIADITWKSEDESVATVDNGNVKGLKPGETYILARWTDENNITHEGCCNVVVSRKAFHDDDKR